MTKDKSALRVKDKVITYRRVIIKGRLTKFIGHLHFFPKLSTIILKNNEKFALTYLITLYIVDTFII